MRIFKIVSIPLVLSAPAAFAARDHVVYHCGDHHVAFADDLQTVTLDGRDAVVEWSEDAREPAREAVVLGHHVAIDAGGAFSVDDQACWAAEAR